MPRNVISWRLGLALWAGLLACSPAGADNGAERALDFELSDGRQFVQLSRLPEQITVINFWRADCPPCVREMPLLAAHAGDDGFRLVTIALQTQAETLKAPAAVHASLRPPVLAVHGPREAFGILARFGNASAALPYTVILDPQRRACARRSGEISAEWLRHALAQCQAGPAAKDATRAP